MCRWSIVWPAAAPGVEADVVPVRVVFPIEDLLHCVDQFEQADRSSAVASHHVAMRRRGTTSVWPGLTGNLSGIANATRLSTATVRAEPEGTEMAVVSSPTRKSRHLR